MIMLPKQAAPEAILPGFLIQMLITARVAKIVTWVVFESNWVGENYCSAAPTWRSTVCICFSVVFLDLTRITRPTIIY